jgi:signal transduction histidine kinase
VEILQGDLNLDRVHHLLGKALENRLRENALRGAVTDLSRHYQDPDRLIEDFLRLAQDLVGGGLAYLFCPGQTEHHLHLLGSAEHLNTLGSDLASRFRLGEIPLRVVTAVGESDELPLPFASMELELPLWGHTLSSQACWGSLAPLANLDRARAEVRIITEEFKPLFAGSQTLVHLGMSNAQLLEADLRKTRLLDTLSHELRAPITAIRLREDLILEGAESLPPETHRLLKANQHIFERLHRMLNGFLQLERIQQGALRLELEPLELRTFLQDQLDDLQMLCAPKGLQVTLDAPAPCVIWADGDRVVQCLINLVTNAIAHSPEGGRIRVALLEDGAHGCIRVQDEGPGVPEAFQASLFQPFQQQARARPDSVGLGLAITQALVQAMGGRIRYLRLPGEGACFQLEFTLQAAPPPEEDPMLG